MRRTVVESRQSRHTARPTTRLLSECLKTTAETKLIMPRDYEIR